MPIYGLSYHKVVQTSYCISAIPLSARDTAVVALDQGQVLARVVSGPHTDLEDAGEDSLPRVLRVAEAADLEQQQANEEMGRTAGVFWKERVRERGLDMKLVDVEVFLDRSKIIFYFTSMSRIDFRELVKDLVHEYRVRIEFRQIGVRHETQMIGALGNCGMVCCCRRFLHQFAPVTIRMAKDQNLFLNPSKVSGMCGRLLCCLAYEQESYDKFHSESPRLGKRYVTDAGQFKVIRSNMFHNSVTCLSEGSEEVRFSLEEWNAMNPRRVDAQALAQHREAAGEREQREEDGERRDRQACGHEKRQTFVTGRVSFRQQAKIRSQEAMKKRGERAAEGPGESGLHGQAPVLGQAPGRGREKGHRRPPRENQGRGAERGGAGAGQAYGRPPFPEQAQQRPRHGQGAPDGRQGGEQQ